MRRFLLFGLVSVLSFLSLSSTARCQSIRLSVDLTDAPRNIYHAQLIVPVKPGLLTLVYPKWIPGNHRPSGPIENVTGLTMAVSGHPLEWQRDSVDMYAFHIDIPAGVSELQ